METDPSTPGDRDLGTALLLTCHEMLTALQYFRAILDKTEETLHVVSKRLRGEPDDGREPEPGE